MSKKNEINVKFNAETKGIREGLAQLNNDLKIGRSELKLNAEQLKGNAEDSDLLKKNMNC